MLEKSLIKVGLNSSFKCTYILLQFIMDLPVCFCDLHQNNTYETMETNTLRNENICVLLFSFSWKDSLLHYLTKFLLFLLYISFFFFLDWTSCLWIMTSHLHTHENDEIFQSNSFQESQLLDAPKIKPERWVTISESQTAQI